MVRPPRIPMASCIRDPLSARPLGDDFARFELRQDLCEHLRGLPPAEALPRWPGGDAEVLPTPDALDAVAIGDPLALVVSRPPRAQIPAVA